MLHVHGSHERSLNNTRDPKLQSRANKHTRQPRTMCKTPKKKSKVKKLGDNIPPRSKEIRKVRLPRPFNRWLEALKAASGGLEEKKDL